MEMTVVEKREVQRANWRRYYQIHRETICAKRRSYMKEKYKPRRKELYHQLRTRLHTVLGDTCVLCKTPRVTAKGRTVEYHEIHGKEHGKNYYFVLAHREDFVPLCTRCHTAVTWLMHTFRFTWNEIVTLTTQKQMEVNTHGRTDQTD